MSHRTKARSHGGDIKNKPIIKVHWHKFVHSDKNDSPAQKTHQEISPPSCRYIYKKKNIYI